MLWLCLDGKPFLRELAETVVGKQLYHHLCIFRHRQWRRHAKSGKMIKMKAR